MLSLRYIYICQLQICPFTCCLFCQLSLGTLYIQGDLFSSETSRIHEFELQKYFCIQIVCKVSNPRKIKLGQHVQMFNLFTHVLRVKIWHYHFRFVPSVTFTCQSTDTSLVKLPSFLWPAHFSWLLMYPWKSVEKSCFFNTWIIMLLSIG